MASHLLLMAVFFFSLREIAFSEVHDRTGAHDEVDMSSIGIDEKLGKNIPLDIALIDENGSPVTLSELIKGPAIITLAYFRCTNLCPAILEATARVLEKLRLEPIDDYSVITVSFNEDEKPEDALRTKINYLKAMERPFPGDGWKFLTGSAEEIRRLTDAVGFRYVRQGEDFLHSSALIIASGDGHIARYLYGKSFLPFDLEMAITEAAAGRSGPSIRKALLFCFSYDPEGRRYVFSTLKVTGILVITGSAVMFIIITRGRRKDH